MGFRFTKQSACRSARVVLAESVPVTGGLSSWFKKLAVRTARVNSDSSVRTGELRAVELRVDESQDVAHGALPLRVVQDFVIHLRIPAHLGCAREAIREGASEVRVYDAVFTREQQQEGAFDALGVGDDGPLRPLDLAPRAGRYHVVDRRIFAVRLVHRRIAAELLGIEAQRHGEGRPQVLQHPARHPRPRGRLERGSEPRAADHGRGDRIARLGLEVAQRDEPPESQAEQQLAPVGAEPHGAPERLQVAEQLAEPRQVARPAAGAAVTALGEQIGREPRVAPPGPAMPVTAMLASVEKSRCAPSAIARTVSSETDPCACSVSSGTLRAAVLMTSAYATTPPMNVSEAPGMSVTRVATMPPVHDSAMPRRWRFRRNASRTTPARSAPSSPYQWSPASCCNRAAAVA